MRVPTLWPPGSCWSQASTAEESSRRDNSLAFGRGLGASLVDEFARHARWNAEEDRMLTWTSNGSLVGYVGKGQFMLFDPATQDAETLQTDIDSVSAFAAS